jgi:hypothetical protein
MINDVENNNDEFKKDIEECEFALEDLDKLKKPGT